MASSSERVATKGAPPPPEEVAAFYALNERRSTAGLLNRHARCAELSDQAARHARRLWGDNSLVVADLRVTEAMSLSNHAQASTSSLEQEGLRRRAWAILVPVHALLLRRLADNTLLPGTIKEEEVTYDARSQAFAYKAQGKAPVPSEAVLQAQGVALGYETLLKAVSVTLVLLEALRGSALPRKCAHSFVLTALDAIPRTAAMQRRSSQSEENFVGMMETQIHPQYLEPAFFAAMLRKWRSSAVVDVLRARGVLQTGVAKHQENTADFEARQRADIEQIGLRECAWPSCDKVERTVREFKQCSGCRSVWYCSPEHHTTGGCTKRIAKSLTRRDGRRWLQAERKRALLDELDARCAFLVDAVRRTWHSATQTWSSHRRCVCVMHIRLTSHGGPRVRDAAARPDGCRRAAASCCMRSPRARVAPRAHPRGGAVPPRRRVLLFAAQRVVLCRAPGGSAGAAGAGGGRGGAHPQTEMWRSAPAAAWHQRSCCADSGGVGGRGGCSALARDCRNAFVATPQTTLNPRCRRRTLPHTRRARTLISVTLTRRRRGGDARLRR